MNRATLIQNAAIRWAQHTGKDLAGLPAADQTQVVRAVCKSIHGVSDIEAREALVSLWSAHNEVQGQGARLGNHASTLPIGAERSRDISRSPLGVMLSVRTQAQSVATGQPKADVQKQGESRRPVSSLLLPLDVNAFASGLSEREVSVHLGSMNHMRMPSGTPLVALLTPTGEEKLASRSPDAYQSLQHEFVEAETRAPGKAQRSQKMAVTLDWSDSSVERIYIPREHFRDFMSSYREGIAKGVLPKKFGALPYTRFFVPSDDMDADLRAAEMRRRDSSFAARSPESQKATAALAHRAASEAPKSIPYTLRLAVYEALIRHERMPLGQSPHSKRFYDVAKEEKQSAQPFHHGTRDASAIAQEGFRSGENNLMGNGIYYGNPSVAAQYANRGPASRKLEHEQVISGRVLPGETAAGRLPINDFVQSAVEPMPMEGGRYHVTREAERFQIRGVTTLDPALAHESLQAHLPSLLALCAQEPDAAAWAGRWLNAFSEDELKKVADASGQDMRFDSIQLGMQVTLLSRGDAAAVSILDPQSVAKLPPGAKRCVMGASVDALDNTRGDVAAGVQHFWNQCSVAELDLAVSERTNSPSTYELSRKVLMQSAAPNSIKRMLTELRTLKPASVQSIKAQTESLHDGAKAKLFYELGRGAEFRPLLHEAAEIEAKLGESTASIELLLRNSPELNDADFAKWLEALGAKNPSELETIAFQFFTKDERLADFVMDVLKHQPESKHFNSFCRAVKGSAYQQPSVVLGIAALAVGLPREEQDMLLQSILAGLQLAGPAALTSADKKVLRTALVGTNATLQEQFRLILAVDN